MDVRCEKCQTEYELDEARLKPGGVTVKCTHCGHMFKIRKRTITNVGTGAESTDPAAGPAAGRGGITRPRPAATPQGPTPAPVMLSTPAGTATAPGARDAKAPPTLPRIIVRNNPPRPGRADSMLDDVVPHGSGEAPAVVERQWLIRLESGEQKSCRELATLHQWIVAGVVTRDSLISRTGKTWKRIGEIGDLMQYFAIADEARANRDRTRQASRAAPPVTRDGTLTGYAATQVAGGTILPDDDSSDLQELDDARTTRVAAHSVHSGKHRLGANTPPPVPPRSPARAPDGATASIAVPPPPTPAARDPRATPPPPPPAARRPMAASGPVPAIPAAPPAAAGTGGKPTGPGAAPSGPPAIPGSGGRATAMWATDGMAPGPSPSSTGVFGGKIGAPPDEPAFAGRVRMAPGDDASFQTGKVRAIDDDDDLLPGRRGSRAGMWVLAMALLAMAGAAAGVYWFVIRIDRSGRATAQGSDPGAIAAAPGAPGLAGSAGSAGSASIGSGAAGSTAADLAALAGPRGELAGDLEPRLRSAAQALEPNASPAAQALRAHLIAQLAQDLQDRATLIADPSAADAMRRDAKQLALDAATAAQRALKAAGDDAVANLAMAEVLRLQGKPAQEVVRYLDSARARSDASWQRDLALASGLLLARDGKLDEARAAFAAIDQGSGALDRAGDVRARLQLALALVAQGKTSEAKPVVESILAAQPDHAAAKALAKKLETAVARTDPLPPEDSAAAAPGRDPAPSAGREPSAARPPATGAAPRAGSSAGPSADSGAGGGESYERVVARANALAESNCAKAIELYARALEHKPNGVEALAGMGYCHIDAKQFASAFSKFRAALAVSPRYEPALRGIAEAYQQQGRKEQAIEAYKTYLDAYPDSVAAKRQLERLGGDAPAAPPPSAPAPSAPAAPAAPPPDPAAPGPGSG
jgi:predicted Zn finger-like uncharacterized protein